LVTGAAFLLPLRHRTVADTRELLGRVARMAVLWLVALTLLVLAAQHSFEIEVGDEMGDIIGDFLDVTPTVGFRTDMPLTLVFGMLWLLGVLALAFAVSPKAPLPSRLVHFQEPVRPAAFAMLLLLLGYVAIGLVAALVLAATRGHADQTFATMLLGLPNVAWLALGLGLGGSWYGRLEGTLGLPVPKVLSAVLRGEPDKASTTVNLGALAEQDSRAWWLLVVAVVLLLATAVVMVVRSPAGMRPWQHAVHMAIALAITMLVICLLTRMTAHYGLSVMGIGDIGGLQGELTLQPRLWASVGLGAAWGLIAGFLGSLLASRVRRRGEVEPEGDAALPKP
jgi:hypothetical protein